MPPDSTQNIGWYEITKDIIIPALGVFATIVIGIIVAGLLKRKEEKAKIKQLLIDSYMKYLGKRTSFVAIEGLVFTHWLFNDILINYDSFFGKDANSHIPYNLIKETNEEVKNKIDQHNDEDSNWSPFTFQFAFLLGVKIYKREAQGLENAIVKNYMSDEPRIKFIADLKLDIKNDHPLRAEMNSTNENRIKKAISVIKRLINLKQSEFQRIHFEPYDNKIADLIDAY